tara:strand:+ start:942 stop:1940 length:999 start_codon:yes stop_codon:yes gene_type:complete
MGNNLLKLPKVDSSPQNVTLISWLIDVGDEIKEGDPIIEVSINKVTFFVPSEFSGELKEKRFKIGDIIEPGEVIAEIENEDEDEDEDEIDEGESNLDNELNTNTKNIAETGGSFTLKYRIVYFILSITIIIFTIWFFLKLDIETDQNKELKVSKEEVEVSLPPEQIITPPTEKIINSVKKKIEPPKKPKKRNTPKVNKIEKKNSEEKDYKDDCLDKEVAFSEIEDVPIFPGCEKASKSEMRSCFQQNMNAHIMRNFHYPEIAQEMGIQGRIYVNFIIAKDGEITNIRTRGPDENLEKEAIRIISILPKMKPGIQEGCPVRVPFSIPITFRLQ